MKRVLLIEDDDSGRELLGLALKPSPFEVTLAADGAEGLKAYGNAVRSGLPFDLIITDCALPRVSGVDVAKRIRQIGDPVKIVFLTAHARELLVDDVIANQITDVWEKPDAMLDLGDRINALLKQE